VTRCKAKNHAESDLMQIQIAARVSCGNEVKHGPYSTGTVRGLYWYCTGLYGGVQFFYFRGFWVLTQWLATLFPWGRFFKTRGPFFRVTRFLHGCHTAPTRAYTVSSWVVEPAAIFKGSHAWVDSDRKASEKCCVSAQDGGQVEKTATCRKRGDHCRGLPHHELAA
jgi:hypothetical protein